jgi:hypothetical protein
LCKIVWHGPSPHTAEDLVQAPQTEEEQKELKEEARNKLEEAKQLLRQLLSAGPVPVKACLAQAASAGIPSRTAQRAARELLVHLTYFDPAHNKQHTWRLGDLAS